MANGNTATVVGAVAAVLGLTFGVVQVLSRLERGEDNGDGLPPPGGGGGPSGNLTVVDLPTLEIRPVR